MTDLTRLSAIPYFMEAFQDSVRQYPQQPMFVDTRHPEGVTRAEADELSARVYAYLKQRGVGKEDMVMICLPRGAEIIIAAIGVWKAGAACVLAEDDLPAERLAFIRADCGCACVIDAALWTEIIRTPPLEGYVQAVDHAAAFAIYTSGSTGTPKGVLHEYGFFRMFVLTGTLPSETPEEAYAETMLSPFNTVMGIVLPFKLLYGFDCAHILPYEISKDPLRLNRYFMEHNIAQTFLPPAVLRVIGDELSPSLRYLVLGGEGVNGLYMDGVTMENSYSMSEVCFPLCKFIIDRPYALCPVGKPASDVIALRLLTPDGQAAKPGETGEICFENPFFRGYIHRPEETKEAFRGGLFHSGDLGRWDENGNLLVTGRVNEMLKIGGNRVEPSEIEAVFRKLTGQDWCAVRGFAVGARTLLCLYYQGEQALDESALRREMGAYLPGYMLPAHFQRIDAVPLLPSGKTNKAALPEPDWFENRPAYVPPETEEEQALCRAFETVFEIAPVGLDDDFFDLGGDSVAAMAVLAEAELHGLSVLDIYEGRAPRRIAQALIQRQAEEAEEDFALSEARERGRAHPLPNEFHRWFAFEHPGDIHLPGLQRFDRAVDAQKLCDALNLAVANRSALCMVIERSSEGGLVFHYDASFIPRYTVQKMTQAEFDAQRPALIQTFEMFGAPLIHAGVYETEQNVYLFVDIHHMVMDGSAMRLFYNDVEKAYRGEPLGQDTYLTYLCHQERERDTEQYRKAKEGWLRLFGDERWRSGFAPDQDLSVGETAIRPCRRMITGQEMKALSQRLGVSENILCVGLTLLAAAKLDGQGNYLCNSVYNNRGDALRRNAFGSLIAMTVAAVRIRPACSMTDFCRELKASWNDGIANLNATMDGYTSSPRDVKVVQSVYNQIETVGYAHLASLGAESEQMASSIGGGIMEQGVGFYEQPSGIVPTLLVNAAHYSPARQEAILDALTAVIDRLVSLTDPEKTTVGQLLD